MSCSRCGQNRPRPISTPSIIRRPGGVTAPPIIQTPAPSAPLSPTTIRSSITGLRYTPNNGSK